MHFTQVFRVSRLAELVPEDTKLQFLGFGTMNGKDGKPFKTRQGGVMRLENLIREIDDEMYKKIMDNRTVEEEDARRYSRRSWTCSDQVREIFLTRLLRSYIFDVDRLLTLREIQDRIFFIQSLELSLSSRNMLRMAESLTERSDRLRMMQRSL